MIRPTTDYSALIQEIERVLAETDMPPVRRFDLEHVLTYWRNRQRGVSVETKPITRMEAK